MDHMDFATHDNTPGPPAHTNAMSQASEQWAQSPAVQPLWPSQPHLFSSHYNSSNPEFASSYVASLQNGPYPTTGIPGQPRVATNMNQYNTPASPWSPASIAHHSNTYSTPSLGSVADSAGHQIHYASRGPAMPPSISQAQLGFMQHAASTNRQLPPGTVNTQPRANAHLNQQFGGSPSYFSEAAPYAIHARHNSHPNPHPQRNVQSRSRPFQTHRHTHSTSAMNPNIVNDGAAPSPSFSERRRVEHMRGRRPSGARFTVSESRGDWARHFGGSAVLYPGPHRQATMNHTGALEEGETRRLQLLRGGSTSKCVVSKSALQSLQILKAKELPENDRTCMICYNEYETESPEGISERPIRLPKCKHVFGNHCIRKWFQDSDSCPYCRDKLHSEPKHLPSSTRAFLDVMRIRGWTAGSEVAEDFYRRIMAGEDVRAYVSVHSMGERRPPPDDEEYDDSSRRTRQRRSSSSSAEPEVLTPIQSPSSMRRARHRTTPNSSGQASPTQAGAASNPWMFMAPESPASIAPNAPLRYQSPARPATQPTLVHQPNSTALPVLAHRTYPRTAGPTVSPSAIPNPLQNSPRASRMLHMTYGDASMGQFVEDAYLSEQESP